ncbi:MAG: 5-formyltetrahydrofolate cyclo-ligase [Alicyclobacillus mali]|uniref:5-formyltetrahydrofolate cyclo-ligase n=1 Tax=Alicyclobacillus mali (ex Roth et al. 2021) TaxID=1123961 RepID=UPI0023F1969B|nr:5-formyltetrahydrofolate cyclo-ligase [Alicyclobacillus mali (ex Roth et al. 2021)]MCL6487747.1 5-formyltetrahydrofolate cyclo-ligase [Alicyclobacillus mali (ex Roth et al. 2021)]
MWPPGPPCSRRGCFNSSDCTRGRQIPIETDKQALRQEYRVKRAAILPDARRRQEEAICAHAQALLRAFPINGFLGLYAAVHGEVDLAPLAEALLRGGANVAFPRVEGPARMEFCAVQSLADLHSGAYGIPAPGPRAPVVPPGEVAVVLVPGLAFAEDGTRLGYGGGFYDRYLKRPEASSVRRIGVCFVEQLVAVLPRHPHDVRMHELLTERGLAPCRW